MLTRRLLLSLAALPLRADTIEQLQTYAREYTRALPNFICTQRTRRYDSPKKNSGYRLRDELLLKLSSNQGREKYELVARNGIPVQAPLSSVHGMIIIGEFGNMIAHLFDPARKAEMRLSGMEKVRGKSMQAVEFRVLQGNSNVRFSTHQGDAIATGYHGKVYVNPADASIYRVEIEAEMPKHFEIRESISVLDYANAEIAGRRYLLPHSSASRIFQGEIWLMNENLFSNYQKFGADATIQFPEG